MNAIMTNVRAKLSSATYKISNSKAYKTCEKLAVGASVGLMSVGMSAINAFAEAGSGGGSSTDISAIVTANANVDNIMKNAAPFVEPAIIIMCGVAGLRLGMKFLRGSAK